MMTQPLVLSIFPGGGLFDYAFEQEGFCVVRGPDPLWGGDVRNFHPPAGRFDGVIGGDPCQEHTPLQNINRAQGRESTFGDLTADFERCIVAGQFDWFLRENSPQAPGVDPRGYCVRWFDLDNYTLGGEQRRRRRFWFGVRCDVGKTRGAYFGGLCERHYELDLRHHIDFPLQLHPEPKSTVTGRHSGAIGVTGGHAGKPGEYSLEEMLRLQGLPEDWLEHQPWTMQAKRKILGNGVAVPTGRQLARAIRRALYDERSQEPEQGAAAGA